MWTDLKQVYRDSARFALALPLVAAIPFAAELIQHVIEVRAGMFDSYAGAEAAGSDGGRSAFGVLKVLTLFLIVYPVVRFIGFEGDRRRAVAVSRMSALLFSAVLLFGLAMMALQQAGGALLGQLIESEARLLAAGVIAFFALMLLEIYLAAWKVAAALGNPTINVAASVRLMRRHVLWGFGFTLLMMMPLMIAHYALNIAAIGLGAGAMWTILVVDSAVTAFLAIVLGATVYRVARRATDRAGVALAGPGEGERPAQPPAATVPG